MATFKFRLDPKCLPPVRPDSSPSTVPCGYWAQNCTLNAHSECGVVANWLPYEIAARVATVPQPYCNVYPSYAQANITIGEMLRDFPPVAQKPDTFASMFDPNVNNRFSRIPIEEPFVPYLPFFPEVTNRAGRPEPEVEAHEEAHEEAPKSRPTKQYATTARPFPRYACSFDCGMRFQKPKDRSRHEETRHLKTSFKCPGCESKRNRPDKLKYHIVNKAGCSARVLSDLQAKGEVISDATFISPENHLRKHYQVLPAPGQPTAENDDVNEA